MNHHVHVSVQPVSNILHVPITEAINRKYNILFIIKSTHFTLNFTFSSVKTDTSNPTVSELYINIDKTADVDQVLFRYR